MIHWQCHSPSPYNTVLFDAIARRHPLRVHYRFGSSAQHPWALAAGGHAATYWRGDPGLIAQSLRDFAHPSTRLAVFGSWVGLPVLACIAAAAVSGRRLALWTDTPDARARRGRVKTLLRSLVCRSLFTRAHAVLGTGSMCLDTLADMGCPRHKLVEFPYIVEPTAYQPASPPADDGPTRLCIVGRLSPEKGVDAAISALAQVRQSGAEVRLSVIGSGPDEPALRALVDRLGLSDCVTFFGWLQRDELRRTLSGHHYLVHAARHEPYGVVVVEALCSGLPVIGTDTTAAVVHRVRHGVNGFVCDSSVASLATAMHQAVAATPRWRALSDAALAEAWTWPPSRAVDVVQALLA
jgi:glycosyltransferase involved in cell wall biosynthesis